MSELLDGLFGDPAVDAVFNSTATVATLLDVIAAIAGAEADVGRLPEAAAQAIRAAARADRIDFGALAAGAGASGNLAIPLVEQLTSVVAREHPDAAQYVHQSATSQDVLDTAAIVQVRAAGALVVARTERAAERAIALADRYRAVPIAGRTWLQQATPTSFGLKLAMTGDALGRCARRLEAAIARAAVVQLGGATGTLAAFGDHGLDVAASLGRALGLAVPSVPWHAHRDRLADVGAALGILAGTLGKVGRDVGLLAQTEVAEAHEGSPGGSSAMPQKRNPVRAAVAIAAAVRAPGLVATLLAALPQEHERGLGTWPAEWETLPALVRLVGGAARAVEELLTDLVVDPERMAANLDRSAGLIYAEAVTMALVPAIGKPRARELVRRACEETRATGRHLRDVLLADPVAAPLLIDRALGDLFDARQSLGLAGAMIDRVRSDHHA
jgi:3-carboxy-cis,cis-muconate cycloisomerase